MKDRRNLSLIFIVMTVAIDSMGLGIIIPPLPDVLRRFSSGESQLSTLFGYFEAVYALMQFLSSPILGRLSDRFGRRPVLLISLMGAAIDYVLMAFAPSLFFLFFGRLVSGVSGASYSVASAYVADISDDQNRSRNFGLIAAGFGAGFIIGPAIGGLLASQGSQYPFLMAAMISVLNLSFGVLILPESLPLEKRNKERLLPRWIEIQEKFQSLWIRGKTGSGISDLILVSTLMSFAAQTHPSIWVLYTRHRYGWTSIHIGVSLAIVGALTVVSQAGLTGWTVKHLGEERVLLYGILGEILSFWGFGLASTVEFLYATLFFSAFFWASQPALQSLMSRKVSCDKQGELQGVLMSWMSLMAIVNPLLITRLFSATSDRTQAFYMPGSPYFLSSVSLILAWLIVIRRFSVKDN